MLRKKELVISYLNRKNFNKTYKKIACTKWQYAITCDAKYLQKANAPIKTPYHTFTSVSKKRSKCDLNKQNQENLAEIWFS